MTRSRDASPSQHSDKDLSTSDTTNSKKSSTPGTDHHRRMLAAEEYAQGLSKTSSNQHEKKIHTHDTVIASDSPATNEEVDLLRYSARQVNNLGKKVIVEFEEYKTLKKNMKDLPAEEKDPLIRLNKLVTMSEYNQAYIEKGTKLLGDLVMRQTNTLDDHPFIKNLEESIIEAKKISSYIIEKEANSIFREQKDIEEQQKIVSLYEKGNTVVAKAAGNYTSQGEGHLLPRAIESNFELRSLRGKYTYEENNSIKEAYKDYRKKSPLLRSKRNLESNLDNYKQKENNYLNSIERQKNDIKMYKEQMNKYYQDIDKYNEKAKRHFDNFSRYKEDQEQEQKDIEQYNQDTYKYESNMRLLPYYREERKSEHQRTAYHLSSEAEILLLGELQEQRRYHNEIPALISTEMNTEQARKHFMRDARSKIIEREERRLNKERERLNEEGNRLDEEKRRLDEEGNRLDEEEEHLDEEKQRLDEEGNRLNEEAERLDREEEDLHEERERLNQERESLAQENKKLGNPVKSINGRQSRDSFSQQLPLPDKRPLLRKDGGQP